MKDFRSWRPGRSALLLRLCLLAALFPVACADSTSRRAASPTAPTGDAVASTTPGDAGGTASHADDVIDRSQPRPGTIGDGSSNGTLAANFPPRNDAFAFRQQLEAQYRDGLRRSATPTFVDLEGSIVWTMEYYRYRVNGCGHIDAISRVQNQIEGRPAPPICQEFTGATVSFPPRNEALGFRIELERVYRDLLRRSAVELFVDMEGDIVWTQEYLRLRVNGCGQNDAVQFVNDQVRGGPARECGPPPPPPANSIRAYIPSVTAGDAVATEQVGVRPSPVPGGPTIRIEGSGPLTSGVHQITLTASQLVDRIALSLDDTGAAPADRIGSAVVAESFYMLTFNPPKSAVTLSIELAGRAINRRLSLEAAASVGGGTFGPYGSRLVDVAPRCRYALSPAAHTPGVNGGTFTIAIETEPGCTWSLASDQSFVTLATTTGTGSGAANYSVASNSGAARGARITLSGVDGVTARHDVSQAGASTPPPPPPPPPPPTGCNTIQVIATVPAAGGTFTKQIATDCAWTAVSGSPFLTVLSFDGRTRAEAGFGSIVYSITANTSSAPRTGQILVTTSDGVRSSVQVEQFGTATNRAPRITSSPCSIPPTAGPGSTISCTVVAVDDDPGDLILWTSGSLSVAGCDFLSAGFSNVTTNPTSITIRGTVPANFRGTCGESVRACDQLRACAPDVVVTYTFNPLQGSAKRDDK